MPKKDFFFPEAGRQLLMLHMLKPSKLLIVRLLHLLNPSGYLVTAL